MMSRLIPNIIFKTRVKDEAVNGKNPFRWQDVSSDDYFKGRKVILFSLPGAFTPTCSTYQLPDFEKLYPDFKNKGIDEIYCISVNDAFVMNAWAKDQNLKNVKVIPDGSGEFTRLMGMLVKKDNLGFGLRSWRYAAFVNDCIIERMWIENGMGDNTIGDSYGETSPENLLKFFQQ
ncbi:MAG: peroxiredoxin [Pseudomonadota bacterium]|nr:peroxiredoxin [Pseudomonadota bacterium]